jgi:hypothetical protein
MMTFAVLGLAALALLGAVVTGIIVLVAGGSRHER